MGINPKRVVNYIIQQVTAATRGQFGEHKYRIYKDGHLVAMYWHDHHGDDHGIEFTDGTKYEWPVGRVTDFLEGGGPQSLALSDGAIAYLEAKQR